MCGLSAVAIAGVDSAWRRSASSLASSPSTHFSASIVRRRRQDADRVEQVARDHRHAHVELEVALRAGDGDRGVVADHLRGHLQHDLGDHRVDLAGHDRRALLQLGQRAAPRARCAGPSPSARGRWRSWSARRPRPSARPSSSTSASRLACASKRSRGRLAEAELLAHARGELGVRVQAGAGGGAAQRDLRRRGRARRCTRSRPSAICAA